MFNLQLFLQIVMIIVLSTINETLSDCRKTFVVHCDNLNDYENYETDTWRQLSVGNNIHRPIEEWSLLNLWRFLIQDLQNLQWLTITNQLHGKLNDETLVNIRHRRIKYLNLYKNNLSNLYVYIFTGFKSLIELNLINNNIKQIVSNGINGKIETLDLSENKLTEIRQNAFINMKIRQLVIRSNQLADIQRNSLNGSLELLYLDYNEFTYVPDEGLQNLDQLKELTMSHNKITFLPSDLTDLKSIEKLNFAYNRINSVRTNFRKFPKLRHLDLSHNSLKQVNFISLIPNNTFEKRISIAFNYLSQFELTEDEWQWNFTTPVTLILFGNPWICQCLDHMQLFMNDRPFRRDKCDLELFGSGRSPTCVNQKLCSPLSIALETSFYDSFFKVLNESKKLFTCNIDKSMLNLERSNRQYALVALPLAFIRIGNKTVAQF